MLFNLDVATVLRFFFCGGVWCGKGASGEKIGIKFRNLLNIECDRLMSEEKLCRVKVIIEIRYFGSGVVYGEYTRMEYSGVGSKQR